MPHAHPSGLMHALHLQSMKTGFNFDYGNNRAAQNQTVQNVLNDSMMQDHPKVRKSNLADAMKMNRVFPINIYQSFKNSPKELTRENLQTQLKMDLQRNANMSSGTLQESSVKGSPRIIPGYPITYGADKNKA